MPDKRADVENADVGVSSVRAALVLMVFRMGVSVFVATSFGFEGPLFDDNGQAKRADHVVEHVVVSVGQPVRADLQGDVPVAEVVGGGAKPRAMAIRGARDGQGLRNGPDHDQHLPVIVEKTIPFAQNDSIDEKNRHLAAIVEACSQPTFSPILE